MTAQELLEKFQWNINRALENGLQPIAIIGILETLKFAIAQKVVTNKPEQPAIVPANSIPLKGMDLK